MPTLKTYWLRLLQNKLVLGCLTVVLCLVLVMVLSPQKNKSFENTHHQIGYLAAAVHQYYSRQPDYWGLNNETALKNGLVPEEMTHNGKIISALGREIIIGSDKDGTQVLPTSREFVVSIHDLSRKACQALATATMPENTNLSLLKIEIESGGRLHVFEWGGEPALPITASDAYRVCGNHNVLSWFFE